MDRSNDKMRKLVDLLKASHMIKSPRVEAAMLKVDRANYCSAQDPYEDAPYFIGYGATISAPHMSAYACEVLEDRLFEGAKVLDVGSGSGILTAIMAHMVGPKGNVYGIEHIKELVELSRENIKRDCESLLSSGRITLIVGDGRNGLPEHGPYDAIHVGATAPELPVKLIDQLKEGGKLVLPIQRGERQMFESFTKREGGTELENKQYIPVRYVPLTDIKSQVGKC